MRRLLLQLLVVGGALTSCRSSGQELKAALQDLPPTGSFAFFYGDERWELAERELERALGSCGYSAAAEKTPDLELRWEAPKFEMICLDFWEPKCDPQRATVRIGTSGTDVLWKEDLPGWCGTKNCLLTLLVRDVRKVLCTGTPRERS